MTLGAARFSCGEQEGGLLTACLDPRSERYHLTSGGVGGAASDRGAHAQPQGQPREGGRGEGIAGFTKKMGAAEPSRNCWKGRLPSSSFLLKSRTLLDLLSSG